VTGRVILFFGDYLRCVCSRPCLFAFRQVKNARAPLGPEYIAKLARKEMAEAGIYPAGWEAHSTRGAAATNFMAKGVPAAFVQGRGGRASAATMATHYARQHQLIPWAELASSPPPDSALGPGDVALPLSMPCQGQLPVNFWNFVGGEI